MLKLDQESPIIRLYSDFNGLLIRTRLPHHGQLWYTHLCQDDARFFYYKWTSVCPIKFFFKSRNGSMLNINQYLNIELKINFLF